MQRRKFIQNTALAGGLTMLGPFYIRASEIEDFFKKFPIVRTLKGERNFKSKVIKNAIPEFQKNVKDEELSWLFNNCFPNTIDTIVTYSEKKGKPDIYVITGDIDAMWLRDSSAQIWPCMAFTEKDKKLKKPVASIIDRQAEYILNDYYADVFYDHPNKEGEWMSDLTNMQNGVHERKWEIDSFYYRIRLCYYYWKSTGDTASFDDEWKKAINTILKVFKDQQKKDNKGLYSFQRETAKAIDTRVLQGYGSPVNPMGLICSAFRINDDAAVFSFLIPSNFFTVVSLEQAAGMLKEIHVDSSTAKYLMDLREEVKIALKEYALVDHEKYGGIYAFEVGCFGNRLLMDDASVPSFLSLPYLGVLDTSDSIYQNTRNYIWSKDNPFFFKWVAVEGIGGPHVDLDMIWSMAITMEGLIFTSDNEREIKWCMETHKNTDGGMGFMRETFHKNDPTNF